MTINTAPIPHTAEFESLCADAKSRIQEISSDDLAQILESATPPLLIDVREADEFSSYHIARAHHLSKGWVEAKIHTLVPQKDSAVVLYCGSGNRSALAADNLQKMGYGNVSSLAGGIKGWVKSGREVITLGS